MSVEALNSESAVDVGSYNPIPPSLTGKENIFLSRSDICLPTNAGISVLRIAFSSGSKRCAMSGIVR